MTTELLLPSNELCAFHHMQLFRHQSSPFVVLHFTRFTIHLNLSTSSSSFLSVFFSPSPLLQFPTYSTVLVAHCAGATVLLSTISLIILTTAFESARTLSAFFLLPTPTPPPTTDTTSDDRVQGGGRREEGRGRREEQSATEGPSIHDDPVTIHACSFD